MCSLRGLWIFRADTDIRLLLSRRFRTVESRVRHLHGPSYVPLPNDETFHHLFYRQILQEEEDRYIPPQVPEIFKKDFSPGAFHWDDNSERFVEQVWPAGPVCCITLPSGEGTLWPVVFIFKKGVYLVAAVGLETVPDISTVEVIDLPEITAAFQVLEDICEFIPPSLSIADSAGIAHLQYCIKSALPFGSPMFTPQLLKQLHEGSPQGTDPHAALTTQQRTPAWKPFLFKGKPKLTLNIVETVNCTLYGKEEYPDECFISGTLHCCADIPGVPEVSVPLTLREPNNLPQITVHNSATLTTRSEAVSGSANILKITCTPPTGPFILSRYRYNRSSIVPLKGAYQLKELSPTELRLLLQIHFHPSIAASFTRCQVRLPLHHRGAIRNHDLKCSAGTFSLIEQNHCIVWNLAGRRGLVSRGGPVEATLLGELAFDAPPSPKARPTHAALLPKEMSLPAMRPPAPGPIQAPPPAAAGGGGAVPVAAPPSLSKPAEMPREAAAAAAATTTVPQPPSSASASATLAGATTADIPFPSPAAAVQSSPTDVAAAPSAAAPAAVSSSSGGELQQGSGGGGGGIGGKDYVAAEAGGVGGDGQMAAGRASESVAVRASTSEGYRGSTLAQTMTTTTQQQQQLGQTSATTAPATATAPPAAAAASPPPPPPTSCPAATSSGWFTRDPFLHGVNCYAEVLMEIPDVTLSGIQIDPKAVAVYPSVKLAGGVSVHSEVLTGKYLIWNRHGEVRASHSRLVYDDDTVVDAAAAAVEDDGQ
ncbi:unnamed protein product [Vitrella brassicaformis CCMP3155]|uniref:MHD domain-containing protein n=1 Tax=Vitrella brassicaformis (strain CCMP3155) TaxID=1169540 RepID=A0A0G4EDJ1_VITBC|nr:unnamed protein product [Vitrella brassicaformis CCMP3155]|eukprot:CEL93782.1 unnamed protein product [Vitrella brassicaformis CCMP3155]